MFTCVMHIILIMMTYVAVHAPRRAIEPLKAPASTHTFEVVSQLPLAHCELASAWVIELPISDGRQPADQATPPLYVNGRLLYLAAGGFAPRTTQWPPEASENLAF